MDKLLNNSEAGYNGRTLMLRAGFVGCGSIARIKHFPAAIETGQIDCVAFYDILEENAMNLLKMSQNPNARVCASPDEIFKDSSIDMVYICVPNKFHSTLAINALENKKHVICEKPMACTYNEALQMHETAIRNKRVLYIAYQNRFSDEALYAKRIIDDGDLGEVYHANAYAVRSMGIPTWGVFTNQDLQGGGSLIDIGTHSIDLILHLVGNYEPLYVCGMTYDKITKQGSNANRWGKWNNSKINTEDSAFAMIVMKNKMTIHVSAAWAMYTSDERMSSFSLYGDKAGFEMSGGICIIKEFGGALCKINPQLNHPLSSMAPDRKVESSSFREAKAYLNAILNNEYACVNGKEALIVSKIIDGIYKSSKTSLPVML
jgi:predicted dehydrogenase